MFVWKNRTIKLILLGAFALLLTACLGAGDASLAPASTPTTIPEVDAPEGDAPEDDAPDGEALDEEVLEVADPTPTRMPAGKYADLEMVTLLPRDAIPAIDNPRFLPVLDADDYYDPEELVIGVVFNGEARAYSVPYLSSHEIVNDTVGGVKIAVTW